jgi:RNA polymerase sigma-70 factor (ECF subfamily)
MRRLADGDRTAFGEVFETLWPILRRYATRVLGDTARAEDAAQRALVKMFERAHTYDSERPALAWALAFAFWECRTEQTQARRARSEHLGVVGGVEVASTAETPEQALGRLEWEHAARELIEQLPETQRALLWAEVEPDLAAALQGEKPATLRKRRQRAVERLREAFRLLLRGEEDV